MAALVQFLAAGAVGAPNGRAIFHLRGTSTPATDYLYLDFERNSQPESHIIELDAYGSAEVYTAVAVDVTIETLAGNFLRQVTLGDSSNVVEVRSDAFTGTDYDGDPALTAGEPIMLTEVLDKWLVSAGAVDWRVSVGGIPTTLQAALGGLAGMFVNVKDPTYGAVGDGVTDDTTAILAALASGGGIVFFPPGTYNVTSLNPSVANIVLMGCGQDASIIRGTSAGTFVLSFADNTVASSKRITGLGFTTSASYTVIIDVEQSQSLSIDHCKFNEATVTTAAIRRLDVDGYTSITISDCVFAVDDAASAILNLSDDTESYIAVRACLFSVAVNFTGNIIDGPDFNVTQCEFDASLVVSGEYHHVDAGSNEVTGKYLGSFFGNRFYDGGSDGFVFRLDAVTNNSNFQEGNNEFYGFAEPTVPQDKGHIYDVSSNNNAALLACSVTLGSRVGKTLRFTYESSSATLELMNCSLVAETVVILLDAGYTNTLGGDVFTLVPPVDSLPPGAMLKYVLINDSGSTIDVGFGASLSDLFDRQDVLDGGQAYWIAENNIASAGAEFAAIFGTVVVAP